jgi:hypothetical protein
MRKITATLAVVLSGIAIAAPAAEAAPTEVNVRIEGKTETLFEGPILTTPHGVRASSDKINKLRRCDGINVNDSENVVPAPTPTAASADAMTLLGETFDARWFNQLEDYFLTRWGPDSQDLDSGAFWGVLVNNVFTKVGGCQYQLNDGDEVLWVFDAFKDRPTLALLPEEAAYSAGPRPLTATAQLGVPFGLEVVSYANAAEGTPPEAPTRTGSTAYAGAEVAPVQTSANGSEKVEASSPEAVTTDSEGKASITFADPGWHRIKATVVGLDGNESVIRSNRLDVCVPPDGAALEGAAGCAELPAADRVRVPPPTEGEIEGPTHEVPPPSDPVSHATGAASTPTGPLHVSLPRLDRKDVAEGRVGVSWRVLSAGPGIESWKIASQMLGRKGARYVTKVRGTSGTSALLRFGPGTYRLRFTVTDVSGSASTVALGKVIVPDATRP